jgi:hypothetical protein
MQPGEMTHEDMRSIILVLPADRYEWAVNALAAVMHRQGVESHAAAVVGLVDAAIEGLS